MLGDALSFFTVPDHTEALYFRNEKAAQRVSFGAGFFMDIQGISGRM